MDKSYIKTGLFYIGIAAITILPLIVFLWMFLTGLKTQMDNLAIPPKIIFSPTLQNFKSVFAQNNFLRYMFNSFIVAVFAVAISLLFGLPAAYAIARFKMHKIGLTLLIARMIPFISYLIPWFIIFRKLRLVDTYIALITTHLIITLPFIIWIMVNFFENVPLSLEEAARIDGCSYLQVFVRILIPVVRNGIFTSSVLGFIFSWNQFLFSLILSGNRTMTVPVAVFKFISYEEINWGGLAAAATAITLPPLILTLFIQKHMIKGLTSGAVKG